MDLLKDGELYLYGFVGDNYWDEGFTATQVIEALAEVGPGPLTVHINSGGGYTSDGVAIYNALKAHDGDVTVIVDSVAFSSASLIAMAGSVRIMREGAEMMIHEAAGGVFGTSAEHANAAKRLDSFGDQMANIYAKATDGDPVAIRKEMKETLWMSPQEAVDRGFATAANEEQAISVAAFDYRTYIHAPDRLVALANENSWSFTKPQRAEVVASASTGTGQKGEKALDPKLQADAGAATKPGDNQSVADQVAAAVNADRKRRSDVLALEEYKGRADLAEMLLNTDLSVEKIQEALSKAASGSSPEISDADVLENQRADGNSLALPGGKPQSRSKASIDRNAVFASRAKPNGGQ